MIVRGICLLFFGSLDSAVLKNKKKSAVVLNYLEVSTSDFNLLLKRSHNDVDESRLLPLLNAVTFH